MSMESSYLGQQIVTGSSDGSVKVWDVENGTLIRELLKEEEAVWRVGYLKDDEDRVVAIFSRDGGGGC